MLTFHKNKLWTVLFREYRETLAALIGGEEQKLMLT